MLLNDLYKVISSENRVVEKTTFCIELNGNHEVFKGHFPGNPVLPGVCTIQIIKELLEKKEHKKLMMAKANTIKYLSFINPEVNKRIYVDIQSKVSEAGMINCNATVYHESVNFCSLKGEYKII